MFLKFSKLYFDKCLTKCILEYTRPEIILWGKWFHIHLLATNLWGHFTHTHTHTHTHSEASLLALCFLNVLKPGSLLLSPPPLVLYICYIRLTFPPKHMLSASVSLHLCWHHPSLSYYYLLLDFSMNLKHGSPVLCCCSSTHFSYNDLSDLSKIKWYSVFAF